MKEKTYKVRDIPIMSGKYQHQDNNIKYMILKITKKFLTKTPAGITFVYNNKFCLGETIIVMVKLYI
jgi:hypothetical protein